MKRASAFGAILLVSLAACGRKEEPPKPAPRTEEKTKNEAKPVVLNRIGVAERISVPLSQPAGLSFDGCSARIRYEDGRIDTCGPSGQILKTEAAGGLDRVAEFTLNGLRYEVVRAPRSDSNYCYATGQWGSWQETRKTWTNEGVQVATLPGSYNIIRQGEAFPATTAVHVDVAEGVTAITENLVQLGKEARPAVQASIHLYTLIENSKIVDQGIGMMRLTRKDARIYRILQPPTGGFSVSLHPSGERLWKDDDHGACVDILADGRILARKPGKESDHLFVLHPQTGKVEADQASVPKRVRPEVASDGSTVAFIDGGTVRLLAFGSSKTLAERPLPKSAVRGFCSQGDHYWIVDDRTAAVWTRGGTFAQCPAANFDTARGAFPIRGRTADSLFLVSNRIVREWKLDLALGALLPRTATAGPIDRGNPEWLAGVTTGASIEFVSVPGLKPLGRLPSMGRHLVGAPENFVIVFEEGSKLLRVLDLDGLRERSSYSAAWVDRSPQSVEAEGSRMVVTGMRAKEGRLELAYKVVDITSSGGKDVRELQGHPLALTDDGRRVLLKVGPGLRFEDTDTGDRPVEVPDLFLTTSLPRVDRSPSGRHFAFLDGATLCVLGAETGVVTQVVLDRNSYGAVFLSDDRVAVLVDNGVQVFEIR